MENEYCFTCTYMYAIMTSGDVMKSKYVEIYSQLLEMIEQGQIKAGEKLPSENELMKLYNVSRDTIRKSLALLEQNGHIAKAKGKGSIVLDKKVYEFAVSGITSFKEHAASIGGKIETKVICLEKMEPDPTNKKRLQLQDDDLIWYIERLRIVDGEGIILDTDIVNARFVPDLSEAIVEDSLYEYLENELQLKIGFAEKEITVQEAHLNDKRFMDLKQYDMVVCVKSYVYLEGGTLFQYTESRHRPDKFIFTDFAKRMR